MGFDHGHLGPFTITENFEGQLTVNSWVAVASLSTPEEIVWKKDTGRPGNVSRCIWSFEGDPSEDDDEAPSQAASGSTNGVSISVDTDSGVSVTKAVGRTRKVVPVSAARREQFDAELDKFFHQMLGNLGCLDAEKAMEEGSVNRSAHTAEESPLEITCEDSQQKEVSVKSVEEAKLMLEKEPSRGEVLRVLAFLKKQSIDAATMASTKIPQTLNSVKSRYATDPDVSIALKELLSTWRRIYRQDVAGKKESR